MSTSAASFVTYLWHYVLARMLYDQLVRPLMHGHSIGLVLLGCVTAGAFALGRITGRRV
jgi:hypothetical protein